MKKSKKYIEVEFLIATCGIEKGARKLLIERIAQPLLDRGTCKKLDEVSMSEEKKEIKTRKKKEK